MFSTFGTRVCPSCPLDRYTKQMVSAYIRYIFHALSSRLERATAAIIHSNIHPRYVVFGDTKISIYADYFEAISFTAIA